MIIFGLAIFMTWSLTYLTLPWLRKFYLSIPNKRSLHHFPKPSGGGISVLIISTILFCLNGDYFVLLFLPLSFLGFLDDKKHIKSLIRFFFQLATSAAIIYINSNNLRWIISEHFILCFFIFFFLIFVSTTIINFINFMDGVDGLVPSCMIITFVFASIFLVNSYWIIVGSLIGFLYYNWQPSKLFIGDIGTNFMSCLFIHLISMGGSFEKSFGIILILFPLFLDPLITIVRRSINKQNIFSAHKLHLYQRIVQKGSSHAKVAYFYLLSCFLLSCSFFLLGIKILILGCSIFAILYFIVENIYAVSFRESIAISNFKDN